MTTPTILDADEHVALPDGRFATVLHPVGDDLILVAINHREIEPTPSSSEWYRLTDDDRRAAMWPTVAAVDVTEAPPETVNCHDCDGLFDAAVEGRWCDNHGHLCASCATNRTCGGCYCD